MLINYKKKNKISLKFYTFSLVYVLIQLTSISVSVSSGTPDAINVAPLYGEDQLTTQTVFGFGDYITTIGNTVMLFTPQGGQSIFYLYDTCSFS